MKPVEGGGSWVKQGKKPGEDMNSDCSLSLCVSSVSQGPISRCGYKKGNLLGELAHMITEAKKSPHRPFTSWRSWFADSMVQSKSKSVRTLGGGGHWCKF